jgi:hypothetical protein
VLLERVERALEGAADAALEQDAVEHAGDPASRIVLDDEPVNERVTLRLEAAPWYAWGSPGCVLV